MHESLVSLYHFFLTFVNDSHLDHVNPGVKWPAKIKKNYGEGILDKTRFGAASYAARAKSYKRNLASSSGGGGGAAASSSMSMVTVGLLATAVTAAAMRAARL